MRRSLKSLLPLAFWGCKTPVSSLMGWSVLFIPDHKCDSFPLFKGIMNAGGRRAVNASQWSGSWLWASVTHDYDRAQRKLTIKLNIPLHLLESILPQSGRKKRSVMVTASSIRENTDATEWFIRAQWQKAEILGSVSFLMRTVIMLLWQQQQKKKIASSLSHSMLEPQRSH